MNHPSHWRELFFTLSRHYCASASTEPALKVTGRRSRKDGSGMQFSLFPEGHVQGDFRGATWICVILRLLASRMSIELGPGGIREERIEDFSMKLRLQL